LNGWAKALGYANGNTEAVRLRIKRGMPLDATTSGVSGIGAEAGAAREFWKSTRSHSWGLVPPQPNTAAPNDPRQPRPLPRA
jgi:hypothetical protein